MTFTVNDNLKTNAIIAASSNSIGTDGQVLQSNGSVIYWGSGVDVTWPGANSNIFFHDNGAISANTQLNWYHANSTFSVSGEGASGLTYNGSVLTVTTPAAGLGGTLNDAIVHSDFLGWNANASHLEDISIRLATGTSWTTAGRRIQHRIDATYMGYMQFNDVGGLTDITFGVGTSVVGPEAVPEVLRITTTGIDVSGTVTASNLSGTNTGDQAAAEIITKIGTPVDNQVAVWTGDGTLEGVSALTYDGSVLASTGNVTLDGGGVTWAAVGSAGAQSGTFRMEMPAAAVGSFAGQVNTLEVKQLTTDSVNDAFMTFHIGSVYAVHFGLDNQTNDLFVGGWSLGANKYKIFHENNSGRFVRGDNVDNGLTTIRVDDTDFIVSDSTDSTTNFIWRDHDVGKLYLGTSDAVITARSDILPLADNTYDLGSTTLLWSDMFSSQYTTTNAVDRVKFAVWEGNSYGMGMDSLYTFGGLGPTDGYAVTFQMSNSPNRGFWWGDTAHSNAQGAMSLTTEGKLYVADSIRVGDGESATTTPGGTAILEVNVSGFVDNKSAITLRSDDTVANSNFTGALHLTYNSSGTDAISVANKTKTAFRIDGNYSATGGTEVDGERQSIYTNYITSTNSGDAYVHYGQYSYTDTNHSAGNVVLNYGVYSLTDALNPSPGTIDNNRAMVGIARIRSSGDVTNTYGGYFGAYALDASSASGNILYGVEGVAYFEAGTTSSITNVRGGSFTVNMDGAIEQDGGTATTAMGVYSHIAIDPAASVTGNAFLYYGSYAAGSLTEIAGTAYGLYMTGEANNYVSSNLTVGGDLNLVGAIQDTSGSPGTAGQVLSSTATGTDWIPPPEGGGNFKGGGEKGVSNSADIFRVHAKILYSDVTLDSDENASCAGPLTINSSVTLTIGAGNRLVIL